MPTNRYKCNCGQEWIFIGPLQDKPCPTCSEKVKPQLPKDISTPATFETVDTSRNVKQRDNFAERAKKRNAAYSKHGAKERARVHGDDPKQHGITEDDAKLV